MGGEKEKRIEQQDNWYEYALRAGIRCVFCRAALTYDDHKTFGNRRLPCVNATDPSN